MWCLANKHIKIKGENDAELVLSETYKDVVAHQRLDESGIETRIEISIDPEMAPAQRLLNRILTRDFYIKIITLDLKSECPDQLRDKDKWAILYDFTSLLEEKEGKLKKDDLTVIRTKITTGMTGKKVCIGHHLPVKNVMQVHFLLDLRVQ